MDRQDCPVCASRSGIHLDHTSRFAAVDYFRCTRCGHFWTKPRFGSAPRRPANRNADLSDDADDEYAGSHAPARLLKLPGA
jgi:hypothetical protein